MFELVEILGNLLIPVVLVKWCVDEPKVVFPRRIMPVTVCWAGIEIAPVRIQRKCTIDRSIGLLGASISNKRCAHPSARSRVRQIILAEHIAFLAVPSHPNVAMRTTSIVQPDLCLQRSNELRRAGLATPFVVTSCTLPQERTES
jgi:hypothetical protein